MAVLNKKIAGATMVEVLVAMVIVMITFGLALMIYINVMNSSNTSRNLKAGLLLNEIAVESKNKKLFLDEEIEIENIKVLKTILPYDKKGNRLHILLLEAFDLKGKKIRERKELVITGE